MAGVSSVGCAVIVHDPAAEAAEPGHQPERLEQVEHQAVLFGLAVAVAVDGQSRAAAPPRRRCRPAIVSTRARLATRVRWLPTWSGRPQTWPSSTGRAAGSKRSISERGQQLLDGHQQAHDGIGTDLVGGAVDQVGAAVGQGGGLELGLQVLDAVMDALDGEIGEFGVPLPELGRYAGRTAPAPWGPSAPRPRRCGPRSARPHPAKRTSDRRTSDRRTSAGNASDRRAGANMRAALGLRPGRSGRRQISIGADDTPDSARQQPPNREGAGTRPRSRDPSAGLRD